jgi:hypothetical protein
MLLGMSRESFGGVEAIDDVGDVVLEVVDAVVAVGVEEVAGQVENAEVVDGGDEEFEHGGDVDQVVVVEDVFGHGEWPFAVVVVGGAGGKTGMGHLWARS